MLDLACEIHGNNDKRFTTGVSVESNAELLALSAPRDYFPKYLKVYSLCIGHAAIRAHGCWRGLGFAVIVSQRLLQHFAAGIRYAVPESRWLPIWSNKGVPGINDPVT
jgi:hypothetical protein